MTKHFCDICAVELKPENTRVERLVERSPRSPAGVEFISFSVKLDHVRREDGGYTRPDTCHRCWRDLLLRTLAAQLAAELQLADERGLPVNVVDDDGGKEVWLDAEGMTGSGICIGVADTKKDALLDAFRELVLALAQVSSLLREANS